MEERQTELAAYGLRRSNRRVPFNVDAGPAWLLNELREWLDDDRQWLSPFRDQWKMLLVDLVAAHEAAGKNFKAHLDGLAGDWREISACKAALGGGKQNQPPDPSVRRRLRRATEALRARILAAPALEAVFDDLIEATDHLGAWRAAVHLRDLADLHGLDSEFLAKGLADLLEDEVYAVKTAREEPYDQETGTRSAGATPEERVSLCRSRLRRTPREVDAVIWLHYVLAPLQPGRIDFGDVVQIFSAKELLDAAARGEDLPPELTDDPTQSDVAQLAGAGREVKDSREEVPEALIRVSLGRVPTASALQLAKETAELVLSLAVLFGSDPAIWLPSGSNERYYDGRPAGSARHATPVRALSHVHREALESEAIQVVAEEWGKKLPSHLPPNSPQMRRIARLALWLRRSRESWEPGRIVLAGRVLEQVAGWAGVSERYRFAREYLQLPWTFHRIYLEIDNCWRGIWVERGGFGSDLLPGAWERIASDPEIEYEELADGRYSFNRRGVIKRAAFLQDQLRPESASFERLGCLRDNTIDGPATAAWIIRLEKDFESFADRERRIRNALVHGGAVGEGLPESLVSFVDGIAGDALHAAIEGTLADKDLIGQSRDYRDDNESRRKNLGAGAPSAEALFASSDEGLDT
jgi:hypothetical protein